MDKEFRQYSRTMAEECTKEQLVDLYIAEVETCVEVEEQLAITEKALELAVADKIRYENLMVEGIVGKGAVVAVPKKEQWYLEQAREMMKSE